MKLTSFILLAACLACDLSAQTILAHRRKTFRSSGVTAFDPTLYGTVLEWNTADSFVLADGANITTTWADSSGHSETLALAQASNYPTYAATGIGGKPAVAFGTANYWLNTITVSSPFTVAFVIKTQPSAVGTYRWFDNSGRYIVGLEGGTSGKYGLYIAGTGSSSTSYPLSTAVVIVAVFNSSGSELWANGTSVLTRSGTISGITTISFGGDINPVNWAQNISARHFILYSGALGTSARQSLEDALGADCGVTITH